MCMRHLVSVTDENAEMVAEDARTRTEWLEKFKREDLPRLIELGYADPLPDDGGQ